MNYNQLSAPGTRFKLPAAEDPDVGKNSTESQRTLGIRCKMRQQIPRTCIHHRVLTAADGGVLEKNGTVKNTIHVLDANINTPVFEQVVYRVSLVENVPKGTLVVKLDTTDLHKGRMVT